MHKTATPEQRSTNATTDATTLRNTITRMAICTGKKEPKLTRAPDPQFAPAALNAETLPRVRARRYTREESIPAEEVIPVTSQGECEPPTGNLKDAANYTQEGEDEDEEERPEIVMN